MDDIERVALTLAATPYRYPAVRENHALEQLGMTPTRYWQVVDGLLGRADAEVEMPREVHRLRRVRDARRRQRRPAQVLDVVSCGRGPSMMEQNVGLQRQAVAGEEDQSAPGWDNCP